MQRELSFLALQIACCLFLLAGASSASATDDARFTFSCDGLPGLNLEASSHNTDDLGRGRATMQPVQFNIGIPARTNSTVLVDERNSPTCTVTINDKYKITSVGFSHKAGGSWTSGEMYQPVPTAHDIDKALAVTPRLVDNQTVTFTMSRRGSAKGNTTVIFIVNYRADK